MRNVIDGAFISMLESRDLCIHQPMDGLFGGNRRARSYGSSAEFADYREYTAGDDLRRIDWNLYVRFEKLYLKLFVDERQLHHRIYIDASASMDWGTPNKGDTALRLAAAFAYLAVQGMDRVSFHFIHQDRISSLREIITGRESFYRAAQELNRTEFYGDSQICRAITREENPGSHDGIAFLISDFLTDSDWKGAVDYLLFHGQQVQLVQILSRDETEPEYGGRVFMLDAEAADEEDERNMKLQLGRTEYKAYQAALSWLTQDIRDFCSLRGAGYLYVRSDESIEKMLFLKAQEEGMIQ